jgi:hypothetical protein
LAYADDLVVLAREEKGMKEMLGNMEKYMRRKKLTVNVEKSKMMVFRKGGGRRKINEWRWEKDKIEEVKEFKYLGYVMNERNTAAAHVRELVKKANKIIGAVWGIGERKFGHDFRRRIWRCMERKYGDGESKKGTGLYSDEGNKKGWNKNRSRKESNKI